MNRQLWKKYSKKIIGGGLVAVIVAAAGIGIPAIYRQNVSSKAAQDVFADTNRTEDSSQKEAASVSASADSGTPDSAADSKNTDSEADRADKTETVYVQADASGKTQEISVEAVLKNPGGTSPIEDVSTLTDIKNTEGDEEFTREKDGTLTWENHGEDITYKGDADAELPVSVKVTYYLDGEEIAASKLAGKSGEVKIRFDYENETDGEEMVPFAVISAAVLPDDVFSVVTVTNGKLISMDGQMLVIGYAFPGLSDALGTEDYEPLADFEIPEYVEITAQAEEFALDFTATIVSNGLFAELDDETLDDVDELTDSMGDLADASDELVDGAARILAASQTMSQYLKEYTDGVSEVSDGAQTLADGIRTLNENKDALESGAEALTAGLENVNTALSQSDVLTGLKALCTQMTSYATAVQTGVASAKDSLSEVDLTAVETAASAKAQTQVEASAQAAIMEELNKVDGLNLTEEQKKQIAENAAAAIASSVDLSGVAASEQEKVDAAKSALEGVSQLGANTGSGGTETASADSVKQISSLLQGIQQLADGSAQLQSGIAAYTEGIAQVSAGADALASGAAQLKTAGASLSEGGNTLTDGISSLKEGLAAFDEEGIEKLGELAGDDLAEIISRLRTLKNTDAQYETYSGLKEGQTGSVRFLIETEEIE